jgi:hypothetical protein
VIGRRLRRPVAPAGRIPRRVTTGVIAAAAGLAIGAVLAVVTPAPTPGTVAAAFTWSGINGTSARTSAAVMSSPVRARFGFHRRWWAESGRRAPITAQLQRKVGSAGGWSDTGTSITTTEKVFDVRIPAFSSSAAEPNVTVRYRLQTVVGGAVREGSVSPAVRFDYHNPHRYTGLTRTLYESMRRYCPDVAIRLSESLPGASAGLSPTGLYEIRISRRVRSLAAIDQRAVILHECGHHLEWQTYGASGAGWAELKTQATALLGTDHPDPIEHLADCIAQVANPGGYLGYGGRCTPTDLLAAGRVLAGDRLS